MNFTVNAPTERRADAPTWSNEAAAGFLPSFLSETDTAPAKEQFEKAYGPIRWEPVDNKAWELQWLTPFEMKLIDPEEPEDPPLREMSRTVLHEDHISVFELSFVAIKRDGKFIVGRMD